ncbi:BREX system P-loop protein BrxC [Propionibacterium sp.]|uniref:BREX system P-loop protein BrxC n=1 Tax=Propionibacterium sp. TaxID=1977903 RepID=UPI0039EA31AD
MLLNEIFAKDVQRPIEGVIKADDTAHLGTEVDEYVLTNEAAKGLDQLLESYTNYTNANGVWISGFFGSGKSHLLKMLAHLLGNVEGQDFSRAAVSQSFMAKAAGDSFLTASLAKAERIPAKSLLFNIDQKATLISKDQTDALLKVFVKVFDESRGYYGNQGHVARFERDLDNRCQLNAFKDAYARASGRDWLQGREQGVLEEENVTKAYAEITGQTDSAPRYILTKYRNEYKVSIEDFAEEVKTWLDRQAPDFRLNFFVDEVGQFIGSNTHLMLNLQTIAESLNTKCRGRAWVFVTSQEDMDRVLGDRTKSQGNDFSKIQARFATRVKLTSADVEEVIRKRLLTKNEPGTELLDAVYASEHANFKTLFDFVDGAKTYRNYTDEDHFVGTYPFVSYQFPLFRAAIESISDHNGFEGRNSSVGERSMLGVVQQVAKDIATREAGSLATFDQMFAGIRASLKSAAQRSIDVAERNLDDDLAIRLLKALFLVKYVDDFKATARNLTVLVYDRFGLNLSELTKQVQSSLALLETQTYIQRNGNVYEYLTNEEQVIEAEIKNVDIDSSEVSSRLNKILSGDVIKTSKIRYAKNGQDFQFGYKLDDQAFGKQAELALHFITPEYPYGPEETRMQSAGKDELRVILDPDERVMGDVRLLIRTEKYTKRKLTSSISANEQRILQAKATQNSGREKELVERIYGAVGRAALVINAADVTSTSQDALARVNDGFQDLISRTYTQLNLLGGRTYNEQQVAGFANPDSGMIDDPTLSKLSTPGEEVLSFVLQRDRLGERVTIKSIVDMFQAKPYGWDLASIEVVVAWLIGTSKVTLSVDSNLLKRSEIAAALRNTQKHGHEVIAAQKTFDQRKVSAFRSFCMDFFDEPAIPKDPLELTHYGAQKLGAKLNELKALTTASRYPFISQLNEPIDLLEQVVGQKDEWYLTDFAHGDDLLDAKGEVIDPITAFLHGGQRAIYDDAANLLAQNTSNLNYLTKGSSTEVAQALADPQAFRGNKMTKLKAATIELKAKIDDELAANRAEARQVITSRQDGLHYSAIYQDAAEGAQHAVDQLIAERLTRIDSEEQIAVVNEIANTFENTTYPQILDQLAAAKPQIAATDNTNEPSTTIAPAPPVKQTVSIKKIRATGVTSLLETAEDIDRYLDALRGALLDTLNDGKRIAL